MVAWLQAPQEPANKECHHFFLLSLAASVGRRAPLALPFSQPVAPSRRSTLCHHSLPASQRARSRGLRSVKGAERTGSRLFSSCARLDGASLCTLSAASGSATFCLLDPVAEPKRRESRRVEAGKSSRTDARRSLLRQSGRETKLVFEAKLPGETKSSLRPRCRETTPPSRRRRRRARPQASQLPRPVFAPASASLHGDVAWRCKTGKLQEARARDESVFRNRGASELREGRCARLLKSRRRASSRPLSSPARASSRSSSHLCGPKHSRRPRQSRAERPRLLAR